MKQSQDQVKSGGINRLFRRKLGIPNHAPSPSPRQETQREGSTKLPIYFRKEIINNSYLMHNLGGCMGVGWRSLCVRRRSSPLRTNWWSWPAAVNSRVREQVSTRGSGPLARKSATGILKDFSCVLILSTLPAGSRWAIAFERNLSN